MPDDAHYAGKTAVRIVLDRTPITSAPGFDGRARHRPTRSAVRSVVLAGGEIRYTWANPPDWGTISYTLHDAQGCHLAQYASSDISGELTVLMEERLVEIPAGRHAYVLRPYEALNARLSDLAKQPDIADVKTGADS